MAVWDPLNQKQKQKDNFYRHKIGYDFNNRNEFQHIRISLTYICTEIIQLHCVVKVNTLSGTKNVEQNLARAKKKNVTKRNKQTV